MEAEIVNIKRFSKTKKIRFYTLERDGINMFMDFITRMSHKSRPNNELAELIKFIENIGNLGYIPEYFKLEHKAARINTPREMWVTTNGKYGLRLYCIVVSERIIILLNGDVKTKQRVMECPNCAPHFIEANSIVTALNADLKNASRIAHNGFEFEMDDDYLISYNVKS